MVGLLLGGASLRTPVILDGVSAGAAALVARAIAPEVLAACIAGHRSAEPGHVAALNKLGLRPLVDLDLRSARARAPAGAAGGPERGAGDARGGDVGLRGVTEK